MLSKEKISELYQRHSRELYAYIYAFLGNVESAEDLLQECFEKFIRYTASHEVQESKRRAFLYKMAHNLSVNYIVRAKRIRFMNLDDHEADTGVRDTVMDELVADDLGRKVYRLLDAGDPENKSIFIMYKELGMSYEEIAATLGLSARTVRRRVKDTLEFLLAALKGEGYL